MPDNAKTSTNTRQQREHRHDQLTTTVRGIVEQEKVARDAKTAKLRALRLAREAGFTPLENTVVECTWRYADLDTALRGLLAAGPAVGAMRYSGEEPVRQAVTTAIAPFRTLRRGYQIENRFRFLVAR